MLEKVILERLKGAVKQREGDVYQTHFYPLSDGTYQLHSLAGGRRAGWPAGRTGKINTRQRARARLPAGGGESIRGSAWMKRKRNISLLPSYAVEPVFFTCAVNFR